MYDPEEDLEEDNTQDDATEISMAKMTLDKAYVCHALKPTKIKGVSNG